MIIPGLTGTHQDCYDLGHQLLENHFIIIPDMPGWGSSQQINKKHTISNYAKSIFQIVSQLKLDPIIMVGHCMGGVISIEFAIQYPTLVRRLFLISPPYEERSIIYNILKHTGQLSLKFPPFLHSFFFIWRNRLISFYIALLMTKFRSIRRRIIFSMRTFDRSNEIESVVEENTISMYRFDWTKVTSITQPIHVISGNNDILVPLSAVDGIMQILPKKATLDIMGGGHLLILESPTTLANIIKKYL